MAGLPPMNEIFPTYAPGASDNPPPLGGNGTAAARQAQQQGKYGNRIGQGIPPVIVNNGGNMEEEMSTMEDLFTSEEV